MMIERQITLTLSIDTKAFLKDEDVTDEEILDDFLNEVIDKYSLPGEIKAATISNIISK